MGPDQHTAPKPRLRESYMAVDHDAAPPEWFVGVVERRHRGVAERWEYGVHVYDVVKGGKR